LNKELLKKNNKKLKTFYFKIKKVTTNHTTRYPTRQHHPILIVLSLIFFLSFHFLKSLRMAESWEDDDVVHVLTIPLTSEQEHEAFVRSQQEGAEYRAQLAAEAASVAAAEKAAFERKIADEKELCEYYTQKYKKEWLRSHHPKFESMSAFHKGRVEKEFREYMKKHHPNPLSLRLTFFNKSAGGGENVRFVQ